MNSLRTISILTAVIASCFTAVSADNPVVRNPATTNRFSAAPSNGQFPVWNSSTKVWDLTSAAPAVVTDAITNGSPTGFRINSGFIEPIGVFPRMSGVEFYDSFEREGITNYPGVSDSGHIWQHAAIGTTTNLVYINEGEFKQTTNGVSGASYWGITRTNNNVNWTWFGGTVKYRGTGANGFEDTATIILSRSLDFNTSQPYLHFRLGRSWLQVQLSQTNTILNEIFPTPLTNNVFYTFNCYVLSNRLVAEVGNYKYEIVNDSLAQNSITNATALIYEHNRRTTNITSGWYVSYGDAWAGTMPFHMQRYMSDGIRRGSNGVINSINFESGGEQRYSVKHESDLFQIYDTLSGEILFSVDDSNQDVQVGGASSGSVTIQRPFSALGEATMSGGIDLNNGVTASRVLMADVNGKVTNVVSSSPSTEYVKADGTVGTPSGGSGGTNFSGVVITNAIERTVWRAGSTTNLTVPWGTTNRIVWHPESNAGLQMSGTPGQGTNEQIIHVMICLTNSGITSVVMPTNEISGLAPFFLTAPSTNEFDFVYNGDTFYIVSYQTPTTGSGQTVVVNTNPAVYTPTIRYVPTVVTGTGGANTNFVLLATQPEVSINGFTNVSIRGVGGYDAVLVDYWTVTITNGSGSSRTLEFSAATNNWRFNGVYGTNAPNTLTNATRLELSGRQHGTNVQVLYSYTPWP